MNHFFKKIVLEFIKNSGGSIFKAYRNTVYTKGSKNKVSFKSFVGEQTGILNRDMDKDEALKILNFEQNVEPKEADILERFQDYYERNDPESGGSIYLRSKIKNAKEALLNKK